MEDLDRQQLLPPYLDDVDAWNDFANAIDTVLRDRVDLPTDYMAKLRDLWIIPDATQAKIAGNDVLKLEDFEQSEREILIKQVNMLGFDFKQSDLLSDEDYQRLGRNLSMFWYGKGTSKFIDFLGFVLNTILDIESLWCEPVVAAGEYDQYGTFHTEDTAGTPIWEGGTWFPTTHVQVSVDPLRFGTLVISKFLALFYAIANYNLVLDRVAYYTFTDIHSYDNPTIAKIVVAYPMCEIDMTINPPLGPTPVPIGGGV